MAQEWWGDGGGKEVRTQDGGGERGSDNPSQILEGRSKVLDYDSGAERPRLASSL